MFQQIYNPLVPVALHGPLLTDQSGLPRYWSAIWSVVSSGQLAASTHMKKLRYIEDLYAHADRLRGKHALDDAPIFLMLEDHGRSRGLDGSTRLFGVNSSAEAQSRIAKLMKSLTGANHSANGLRHSAAQRLVDAGANHEELAEFMGHSDVRTGLVYYEASSTQAERVNKALGLSTIYRAVAKIAHDRFISSDELTRLKDDQQIAGVPHGMPISGIGGCTSGQPACPYNPITSCYGCRKFMPVHDKAVHERVLVDFRSVVTLFQQSSRGDANSPAYLQLQRTINDVKVVIDELEGGDR